MASGAKQKVVGRVTGYPINLGYFVMNFDLYVTILGSYYMMISMDWFKSHDAILYYKTKQLSLTDDEGHRRVIVGRNQGMSLTFIYSL
jgi:hypothetical protein